MELGPEKRGVVHRRQDGVGVPRGVHGHRLEQARRGCHVQPLGRWDHVVGVDQTEGGVLVADARHTCGAVRFVADHEIEDVTRLGLHVGHDLDRLVGGEHHRHLVTGAVVRTGSDE